MTVTAPAPRARSRPALNPEDVKATPQSLPVIGGPKRPDGWTGEGKVWPQGTYHCLEGKPIKSWPYRAGNDIIGLIYHEYRFGSKSPEFVTTHVYELVDRTWRYLGKVGGWDIARQKLDDAYERRQQEEAPVQPVAARPRTRARVDQVPAK